MKQLNDFTMQRLNEISDRGMICDVSNEERVALGEIAKTAKLSGILVYPDENLMNRLTDIFHDTVNIFVDEDNLFVRNPEDVITAIINHYHQSLAEKT